MSDVLISVNERQMTANVRFPAVPCV